MGGAASLGTAGGGGATSFGGGAGGGGAGGWIFSFVAGTDGAVSLGAPDWTGLGAKNAFRLAQLVRPAAARTENRATKTIRTEVRKGPPGTAICREKIAYRTGRRTVKIVPFPTSDETSIVPSCN